MMVYMKDQHAPRVVVIGAGFGGLEVAKGLRRAPVHVTVLDRTNHHLFQPLLYQVATAGLSPAEIAMPIRKILRRHKNTRVLLEEVNQVDLRDQYVQTTEGPLPYDYLVLAMGAQTSYFGREQEFGAHALGLKSIEDALLIRHRILCAFEKAECEPDADKRKQWMTFVVIGAGPTGVELAGAVCELARFVLARDFRLIHPDEARVLLVEAGPRVLPSFHPLLSEKASRSLEKLGCEVRTETLVTRVTEEGVQLQKRSGGQEPAEEWLPSRCVLWAAGVQATFLTKTLGVALDKAGRIVVHPDLTVPGYPQVFAIGDTASFAYPGEKPLPGTSPVAMQQGRSVARSIRALLQGQSTEQFRFFDKGNMATIGRSKAIVEMGSVRLDGRIAWWAWLLVHLMYLVGFRNRAVVLLQWFWSYVLYQRGARLITTPERTFPSHEPEAS